MTAVCQALKDSLIDIGAPADRVHVILHGVDTALFVPPKDRAQLRSRLGLTRPTLLSVGGLIERKGHHIAIEAMRDLPDMELGRAQSTGRAVGPDRTGALSGICPPGQVDRIFRCRGRLGPGLQP